MLNAAYDRIFKKIKEIRGLMVEDSLNSWTDIMKAYDNFQTTRVNGLQIAERLMEETKLSLGIIYSMDGKSSPQYIVASNKIAYNALDVIRDMVEHVSNEAFQDDLIPSKKQRLLSLIEEIHNTLANIAKLFMLPHTEATLLGMLNKVSIAEKHLSISETTIINDSASVASHTSS